MRREKAPSFCGCEPRPATVVCGRLLRLQAYSESRRSAFGVLESAARVRRDNGHLRACGLNLGLLMRQLMGVGTPRGLQGRACAFFDALLLALHRFWNYVSRSAVFMPEIWADPLSLRSTTPLHSHMLPELQEGSSATAC